jgi:hypothetical protein
VCITSRFRLTRWARRRARGPAGPLARISHTRAKPAPFAPPGCAPDECTLLIQELLTPVFIGLQQLSSIKIGFFWLLERLFEQIVLNHIVISIASAQARTGRIFSALNQLNLVAVGVGHKRNHRRAAFDRPGFTRDVAASRLDFFTSCIGVRHA